MRKRAVATITLKRENKRWVEDNLDNFSAFVDEIIERRRLQSQSPSEQRRQEVEQEMDSIKNKMQHLNGTLLDLEAEKNQLAKELEEKRKAEQKAEEQKLAAKNRCQNCGTTESPKWQEFPIGWICNACYGSSDASTINKWMQGGKQ